MKARLLTFNEISGKYRLDIIRKKGTTAKATDSAKATGVWSDGKGNAVYYLETPYDGGSGYVIAIEEHGYNFSSSTSRRQNGVRVVLEFESINEIFEYGGEILEGNKLRLGTYSNNAMLKDDQERWSHRLCSGKLEVCGKYTFDETYNNNVVYYNIPIYEYNGKRATLITINSSFNGELFLMSNGEDYRDGDYVWHEVKDVMWDFDKEKLIAVSEDVILGGIQFCNEKDNYHSEEEFPKTNMSKYLNDVFLPELLQFQNITLDNKEEDSNLDEVKNLLCKLENNRRYIKYLEEENEKYKKFLDEVNANLENIVHQINKSNIYKPQN